MLSFRRCLHHTDEKHFLTEVQVTSWVSTSKRISLSKDFFSSAFISGGRLVGFCVSVFDT